MAPEVKLEWKAVPEFHTYEVSSAGDIRNVKTGKILKHAVPKLVPTAAPCVSLVRESKIRVFEVRFIVACAFLGVDINARPKPKIEYIDGDKSNNCVANLRIKSSESLPGEEWRPIEGFEDSYAVSNLGRVKRLARVDVYKTKNRAKSTTRPVSELILKSTETDEYYQVNLIYGEKSEYRTVHRLVATAFIPNPENLPQVNHINGNKHDNRVANLEWCSAQANVQHSIQTGLRDLHQVGVDRSPKQLCCCELDMTFATIRQASRDLNIPEVYLGQCIKEGKECHGYHFELITIDRRIKCLDTGQIFLSEQQAKEELGLPSKGILDSIARQTCYDGYTFYLVRDLDKIDEKEYLQAARAKYSQWPRAHKRWED
jgi:hypothetical protein